MAHILSLENVSVTLGSRPILGDVNLSLEDGSRVGVVGPNGGGKSTLLALLLRRIPSDTGRVTCANGTRFSYLSQHDTFDPDITAEYAIRGDKAKYLWASDASVRNIHAVLLPDVPLRRKVCELSGGQRRRVALAAALCAPADVLVLDEPTNHLDIEGIAGLARLLRERFSGGKGALVTVTHDRWFLDAVCAQMWEVIPGNDGPGGVNPQPGSVQTYEGGYAAYILQRAERARLARAAEAKRNNLLRKELAWLRRGAPARTSKPRFRIEAANALIAAEPPPRDTVALTQMATARLGKDVIDLINVDFAWKNGAEPVLRDVTLRLAPGQRIGILGKNGAGKSSLLDLLAGTAKPGKGKVKRGKTVRCAVLSQDVKELDEAGGRRVTEAISDIAARVTVGKREVTASRLAERLGFTRERALTRVAELSGGERRRLQFLRLLMGEPNVLLLDEPTNDLDTDTLAAIEDLLDSWPGTLIVVSHDRYLLERVTDRQIAVIGHRVRDLPGGVEEYLELSRAAEESASAAGAGAPAAPNFEKSAQGSSSAARARAAQKTMNRVEKQMEKTREKRDGLALRQTEQAMNGNYGDLARLGKEISGLEEVLARLEEEWLKAGEEFERYSRSR